MINISLALFKMPRYTTNIPRQKQPSKFIIFPINFQFIIDFPNKNLRFLLAEHRFRSTETGRPPSLCDFWVGRLTHFFAIVVGSVC